VCSYLQLRHEKFAEREIAASKIMAGQQQQQQQQQQGSSTPGSLLQQTANQELQNLYKPR